MFRLVPSALAAVLLLAVIATSASAATPTRVPVRSGHTATADVTLAVGGAVAGTITDAQSGAPIAGAVVDVIGPHFSGVVTTGSDGGYRVNGVPDVGPVHVCSVVEFAGATPAYGGRCSGSSAPWPAYTPAPSTARSVPVTAGAVTTVDLPLEQAGGFALSVYGADGTGPFSLDTADIIAESTDGRDFVAPNPLPAGDYRVCVDATTGLGDTGGKGYVSACAGGVDWLYRGSGLPSSARIIHVEPGRTTPVRITLPVGAQITGTVRTAARPRHGADGVVVEVYRRGRVVRSTMGYGTYRIRNIPSGTYQVCVRGGLPVVYRTVCRYHVATRQGHRRSGIDFLLHKRFRGLGSITGTITGPSGKPVHGLTVLVFTPGSTAPWSTETGYPYRSTVRGGHYRVDLLAPYPRGYRLCFAAGRLVTGCYGAHGQGYDDSTAVPVHAGQVTRGIDVRLTHGGAIGGRVSGANGDAPEYVDAVAYNSLGSVPSAYGVDTGDSPRGSTTAYRIAGLPPSRAGYTVCVRPEHGGATAVTPTGFQPACFDG